MGVGSVGVDVDNSTFLIGALPKDSFLVDYGYVVDILVAQNPHFHDNWQIPLSEFLAKQNWPLRNSPSYDLG